MLKKENKIFKIFIMNLAEIENSLKRDDWKDTKI